MFKIRLIYRQHFFFKQSFHKLYPTIDQDATGQMISDSCHGKECCDFKEELTGEEGGRGEGVTFDENFYFK